MSTKEELRIGELAAWRFAPRGERKTTVVMAHGFSMTMRDGLELYAQPLSEAGHEVLVFDYRHLGESGGEPRQRFRKGEQLEDWRSAISYAREGLGAEKVVLWGFSMGGGHVTALAAKDRSLHAAIVLCPYLDGFQRLRRVSLKHYPYLLPRAIADLAGRHRLAPVTAPIGDHALMNFEGEYEGFLASRTPGSQWRNEISPGVVALAPFHHPAARARRIQCPVWAGIGNRDITVSGKAIERLARRAPRAELHRYDTDHFEPFYREDLAARIAGDQIEFLAALP